VFEAESLKPVWVVVGFPSAYVIRMMLILALPLSVFAGNKQEAAGQAM